MPDRTGAAGGQPDASRGADQSERGRAGAVLQPARLPFVLMDCIFLQVACSAAEGLIALVSSTRYISLVLGAACLAPGLAAAHANEPPAPHEIWTAWTFDPFVLGGMLLLVGAYGLGLARMWRRAGLGRGIPGWRLACFVGSVLALGLALIWPLDALGDSLFSAHMAQHLVLMLVAPPLLIVAAPIAPALHALPPRWRTSALTPARSSWSRWAGRSLLSPGTATLLQLLALYAWHTPVAIAAALDNDLVHSVMHASLLGTALLFWWAIIRAGRIGYGWGILMLLITAKLSGLLGALIAFARTPLYPAYGDRPAAWGLSLLEDQQLAGTLMLAIGGVAYVLTAVVLVGAFLAAMDRRVPTVRAGSSDERKDRTANRLGSAKALAARPGPVG